MKHKTNALALLFATAAACVDSGCPEGSEEVGGVCMERSASTGDRDGGGGSEDGRGERDGAAASADGGPRGDGGTDAGQPRCADVTCGAHAFCDDEEQPGVCQCEPRYARAEGTDGDCEDIDECASGENDCDDNASCTNEPGSFTCACDPGYEGDGTACEPNPCEPRANPCDLDTTTCRDDGGVAVCDCVEGRDRCDGDAHACTTDLQTDRAHCGACGAGCAGDLACNAGACEQRVVQLALGQDHSCALTPRGEVLCWGSNSDEQLQRADNTAPTYEPAPTRFAAARSLSTNMYSNCVLTRDHDLICWGNNWSGWIASGPQTGAFTLMRGYTDARQVVVGSLYACVLSNSEAECWGLNVGNVLGDSARVFADRSVRIGSVAELAAGFQACALRSDRRVWCWGDGVATPRAIEAAGGPLEAVVSVSVSGTTSTGCAALADGRAMCWGDNGSGQLGNSSINATSIASAVPVTTQDGVAHGGFEQVAVGGTHACGRKSDGSVMCWGARGRLGNGGTGSAAQRFATTVRDIDDAIDIAAGINHTCVRRRSGQVQCWGDNNHGQLGIPPSGANPVATAPVDVIGLP
jgi:alpha-tubulin suppressor-like RCC1 family protein